MTTAPVLISFGLATAGTWLFAQRSNGAVAAGLLILSLVVLIASQPLIKAVFVWLALAGCAGFCATLALGLLSDGRPVPQETRPASGRRGSRKAEKS